MRTEWKTVLGTWAAFLGSGAALSVLEAVDLSGAPAWAAVAGGAALTAGVSWLTAYRARHRPGRLSLSARAARVQQDGPAGR